MALRVGIPQALLYYKYHPMWKRFFESLGAEVVVSPPTNKRLLAHGTEAGENELCLPVKVFFGHAKWLDGQVDHIFVPRIVSVNRREYTCPKFLGLPDMTRALGLGTPILTATFNLREGNRSFLPECYRLGRRLCSDPLRILRATREAVRELGAWRERQLAGEPLRLPPLSEDTGGRRLRIGVAGHPYNIYDPMVSMELVRRLGKRGIEVLTPETVSHEQVERGVRHLPKTVFWTYEKEIVGSVKHWVDEGLVDGVVYLLSFSCGPDSLMQVLIEDATRGRDRPVPLLSLVVDEHSGEAGFVTRLEAFLDMLAMREGVEMVAKDSAGATTCG